MAIDLMGVKAKRVEDDKEILFKVLLVNKRDARKETLTILLLPENILLFI